MDKVLGMDPKKSPAQLRSLRPNTSKRKPSNFNFFRKTRSGIQRSLSGHRPQRPQSRYSSLKANNTELAKSLERSNIREAELKDQISQLQDDNLDLIKKLQCIKEGQELETLSNVCNKRRFINKLIEAVDLMAEATVSCEHEEKAGLVDLASYGRKRKAIHDSGESRSMKYRLSRERFVTFRDRQTVDGDDSVMQLIGKEGSRDVFMERQEQPDEGCNIETNVSVSMQSDVLCDQTENLEEAALQSQGMDIDCCSHTAHLNPGISSSNLIGCMEKRRSKIARTLSTRGFLRSIPVADGADIAEAEERNAVNNHAVKWKPNDSDEAVASELQGMLNPNQTSRGASFLKDIPKSHEANRNLKRTFEVLDESRAHTGATKNLGYSSANSNLASSENESMQPCEKTESTSSCNHRLSKGERRYLKRKQRKGKQAKRNKTTFQILDENSQSLQNKKHSRALSLEGKENVDPICNQHEAKKRKVTDKVHVQSLCCSPVASVVKRLFSPMHTKSPFSRREQRNKRKISYAEPPLGRKLRRGDPCTDSSLYDSPHFGSKMRSRVKHGHYQLVRVAAVIREEC